MVVVLRAVLVFHGCVGVKQTSSYHSNQESYTEESYFGSLHEPGVYWIHFLPSNNANY